MLGQFGGIILTGLKGFVGEENDLFAGFSQKPDDLICSWNEVVA